MRLLMLGALLLLAACATRYGDMGVSGGVEFTQLDNDIYKIHAAGNGYSEPSRTRDFILLKAAELANEGGYTHFLILSSSDWSKEGMIATPGTFTSTTNGSANGFGGYYSGSAYTTGSYMPPSTTKISKPRSDAVVKLLKNPPPEANAINASMVYNSLSARYK